MTSTRAESLPEIDVLVHEPARLRILTLLTMVEGADFMYLLRKTGLSRGNLSVQMSKLEGAAMVHLERELAGNRPRTTYFLSKQGLDALRDYKHLMLGMLASFPD